jgi:transcriptional regulator GlxA family with amidase domain
MEPTIRPSHPKLRFAPVSHPQPRSSSDYQIQQTIALLTQNLEYPWQISELAEVVGIERRQLERRFRMATGHSPLQYLCRLRLQKAAELLSTTSHPIQHIAEQVGIPDKHHFRRSFQTLYGVSPGEYRKCKGSDVSQMTPLSKRESSLR